jgi:hypothetical protein
MCVCVCLSLSLSLCMHTLNTHVYIHSYVHAYREREREIEIILTGAWKHDQKCQEASSIIQSVCSFFLKKSLCIILLIP